MSNRVNVPFTNEHFVAFCLSMLGQPYWYGTVVYKCTESLRARKAKQYPSHYGSSRTARYRDDIARKKVCADCVGLIKGYAWTGGGLGVAESIGTDKTYASKYGGNGCPDKSANGMFSYAKSKGCAWGAIDTLPEIPGVALCSDGHVGVYVGNGYAVEERGFNYGCVKTKVASRKWTHWYKLPFIQYGEGSDDVPMYEITLGSRLLHKGMKGADVKTMQEKLLLLGYELPEHGADASFGPETEAAVLAFQKDAGLEEDGKYGDKTHDALMDALADREVQEETPPTVPVPDASEQDEEADATTSPKVVVVSEGGSVNIRRGNGTEYARITSTAPGTTFDHVATASNGWHAIVVNGQVGWVSGEYSRII